MQTGVSGGAASDRAGCSATSGAPRGALGRSWRSGALVVLSCAVGAAALLAEPLFGGRSTLSFATDDPRIDQRPWARPASGPLPAINPITPDIDAFVLPGLVRARQLAASGAGTGWDGRQLLGQRFDGNIPFPVWLPTGWLVAGLDPVSALDVLLWLHLVLAAALAWRAARVLGCDPPAAAFAAVGFALSGWMSTRWHVPHLLYTATWWPGQLVALARLREGRVARGIVEGALFTGLMLVSGFPQAGLALTATLLPLALMDRALRRPRALAGLAAGLALGLALAAPQLVPTLGTLARSARAAPEARAAAAARGLPPAALAGALLPEFFGRPSDFAAPEPPAPSMEAWLPQRRWLGEARHAAVVEHALYPGLLVLLLLPLGWWAAAGSRTRHARSLLTCAALALCVALLAGWVAASFARPGTTLGRLAFGGPNRCLVIVAACLPFAAALGLQALFDGRARGPWRCATLLALALVGASVASRTTADPQTAAFVASIDDQALRQLGVLAAGLVALGLARRAPAGAARWLPALVLLADLALLARAFNPFPIQSAAYPSTPALAALAERSGRVAVLGQSFALLPPSAAALHGIDSVHGVAPMVGRRTAELLACIEGPLLDPADPRVVRPFREPASLHHPLLDLLAVTTVVHADRGLAQASGLPELFVSEVEGLGALARPSAGPRAFLCGGARVVPDADARLVLLADPGFAVHRSVLLERAPPPPAEALPPEGPMLPATHERVHASEHRVGIDAPFAGLLVLTESHDPGWRAEVDGVPAEVLLADHALMAVALESGPHQVVFRYDPPDRAAALGAAAGALALLALLSLADARRRRP